MYHATAQSGFTGAFIISRIMSFQPGSFAVEAINAEFEADVRDSRACNHNHRAYPNCM